jgi:hypothetical protein
MEDEIKSSVQLPDLGEEYKGPQEPFKKRGRKSVMFRKNSKGKIVEVDKVEFFIEEFFKNGGNATKAALAINPEMKLSSAASKGVYFLNKAKERGLVRTLLERKGYDFGRMLDVAVEKMEKSKKPDWWDRVMKMADYEDFTSTGKSALSGNVAVNIFNAHRELTNEYVEGEVVEETPSKNED